MKKFFVKLIGLCLAVALTLIGIAMVVLLVIPPQFQDTAFSVIVRKYDQLCQSESPKVIIVGGSSGAFGIDRQLLENKLGIHVCNMAHAAGLGMPFSTNLVRDSLQKGDLVVLAYEYSHWNSLDENMQPEVIMAAVDGRPELLKYVEPASWSKLMQYYPTYMFKKLNAFLVHPIRGAGVNCSNAYDENGDLIYSRPDCTLPDPIEVSVQIRSDWINSAFVQYVNSFINFANSRGAQVVISCPPLLDEAVTSSPEEIQQFEQTLAEQMNCPVISHVEDYVYSREWMFDTIYHCNERGMEKRTTQLSEDLLTYLIAQREKIL